MARCRASRPKIGVVANRVREYTLIFEELDEYLTKLRIPYLASLREAQNYVRAYYARPRHLRAARVPCLARLGAMGSADRVGGFEALPALI